MEKKINYIIRTLMFFLLLYSLNNYAQCWREVSTGGHHTLAIKTDGTLWAWGRALGSSNVNDGQLGLGSIIADACTPLQIGTDNDWKTISASRSYSLAIKNNGTLWGWGSFNYGNNGLGLNTHTNIPTQIGSSSNWKSISSGYYLAMGIKTDGTIWGWSTYNGGFGNSVCGIPSNTPTQLGSFSDWKEVSCGANHAIAIKNNGTLWACGSNAFGELGNGTSGSTASLNTFTQIGNDTNWKTVSSGEYFTVAIKNNGTLWGWGRNNYNQLGDGTLLNKNTPTQIGLDTDWNIIETDNDNSTGHSFGIKTNGTLWAWGRNATGNLGNGNTNNLNTPTQIGTDNTWVSISTQNHTLGIKNNNTMWGCGSNTSYNLGIPDSTANTNNRILNLKQVSCSHPIAPSNDSGTAIFGTNSTPINNVLSNDFYFGSQATFSNVKLNLVSTTNSGITLNQTTGAISVSSTVPVGTYTLVYKICDINNDNTNQPTCLYCGNTAIVTIVVNPLNPIIANQDSGSSTFSIASTPVANVRSNDTYNGVSATSTNTTLSFVSSTNTGITLNTTTGAVGVAGTVPAGTYTLTYQICAVANPSNCATGTVTITVNAITLVANADSASVAFGIASTPIANVRANDTYNGVTATSSNTTLTLVSSTNTGVTLNTTTGAINVSAVVPVGTHTLVYKICATNSPTTCTNGTVTITVTPPVLVANNDSGTSTLNIANTPVANVRANDTYNGLVATSSNTVLTFVSSTHAGITLNTTSGAVSKAATVPVGTYTLIYKICATNSPTTCVNGTVTITVTAPPALVAVNDAATVNYNISGSTVAITNVRANDTVNGVVATSANTTLALVSSSSSGILLNTTTGAVNVNAYTPLGTYTLVYKICSSGSTTNCVNGTVTIIVRPALSAVNDSVTISSGVANASAINVRTNDKYNFAAATSSNTTLSLVSSTNSGITLNTTTGMVGITASVPSGTHTLVYNLCAISSPTTCATGTVTIIVNPVLVANSDSGQSIYSIGGPNVNVLANDTVNGLPATTSNVVLTLVSSPNPGITLNTSTGQINVASTVPLNNTIHAIYTLTYKICSIGSTTNCVTGTATITVFPKFICVNDNFTIVRQTYSVTSTQSVLTNDSKNDISPLPANNNYTSLYKVSSSHPGINIDISESTQGQIYVQPTVPLGAHTLDYKVCWDYGNPQVCSYATVYINVVPAKMNDDNYTLDIYPNPSKDIFNINLANVSEKFNEITIYNLLGEKIYFKNLIENSENQIDLSHLPDGCYISIIRNTSNGVNKKVKFIKE